MIMGTMRLVLTRVREQRRTTQSDSRSQFGGLKNVVDTGKGIKTNNNALHRQR